VQTGFTLGGDHISNRQAQDNVLADAVQGSRKKTIIIMKKEMAKIFLLVSKLRRPLALDFISKNILEMSEEESKELLDQLINKNVVVFDDKKNKYRIKPDEGKR
jgi:uncharacterized protein YaaW (UPF0174 family)